MWLEMCGVTFRERVKVLGWMFWPLVRRVHSGAGGRQAEATEQQEGLYADCLTNENSELSLSDSRYVRRDKMFEFTGSREPGKECRTTGCGCGGLTSSQSARL